MAVLCLLGGAALVAASEITAIETSKPMLDVSLVTNDGARLTEFYGEILGLKALGADTEKDGVRRTRFQAGAGAIEILVPAKPAAVHDEEMNRAIGIRGVALYLPDAQGVNQRMVSHGRPALTYATDRGAIKVARIKDPDGNWLELIFMAGAPADKYNQMAIILMVADEAKSREFYGKTLGLSEAPPHGKPETGLFYAYVSGGSSFMVHGAPKDVPNRAGAPADAVGLRAVTFTVSDPGAVERFLRGRGVTILAKAPALTALDPDGNYLRFVSEPAR